MAGDPWAFGWNQLLTIARSGVRTCPDQKSRQPKCYNSPTAARRMKPIHRKQHENSSRDQCDAVTIIM
jgi:hypothetical protein